MKTSRHPVAPIPQNYAGPMTWAPPSCPQEVESTLRIVAPLADTRAPFVLSEQEAAKAKALRVGKALKCRVVTGHMAGFAGLMPPGKGWTPAKDMEKAADTCIGIAFAMSLGSGMGQDSESCKVQDLAQRANNLFLQQDIVCPVGIQLVQDEAKRLLLAKELAALQAKANRDPRDNKRLKGLLSLRAKGYC